MSEEDDYSHLPEGSVVGGYEILSVLGSGGFGVTYLAVHQTLDRKVALKECLPVDFAWRRGDSKVGPRSAGQAADLVWAKDRFLQEAKTVAQFGHVNVVHIYDVFEANGTAYMATGYVEGRDLESWLRGLGRDPTEAEIMPLLDGILSGLSVVHAGGVLHRDIKPENIYVTDAGQPVLLDFGSARQFIGGRSRSMTSVLTPGYAPPEQYYPDGNQGAWTDIYGLCATLHRCLCGESPPDGSARDRRGRTDPYQPLVERLGGSYRESLLAAIDAGLGVNEERRPQSVDEFRDLLSQARIPASEPEQGSKQEPVQPPLREPTAEESETPVDSGDGAAKPKAKGMPFLWMGLAAILLIGLVIFFAAPGKLGSVLVRTNPAGATVEIEGLGSGASPYRAERVQPGLYRAKLSLDGYFDRLIEFEVAKGQALDLGVLDLGKETDSILTSTPPPVSEAVVFEDRSATSPERVEKVKPKSVESGPELGSLHIASKPSGAKIEITGLAEGTTPFRMDNVKPGRYRAKISKIGYQDKVVSIEVSGGKGLETMLIQLTAELGSVYITSSPSGAKVEVAATWKGTTPFRLKKLRQGRYVAKVSKEGYHEQIVSFEVIGSENVEPDLVELEPLIKPGGIYITTEPSIATVEIKGLGTGKSPYRLEEVIPGKYEVIVTKDGFREKRIRFVVTAGVVNELDVIHLEPRGGKVTIESSPQGARIIDISDETGVGRFIGYTPLTVSGVAVGSKVYSLELKGYEKAVVRDELAVDGAIMLSAALEQIVSGSLTIESKPSGAQIWQGENLLGVTPCTFVNLPPGDCTLELSKEGYGRVSVTLSVIVGEEVRKMVELGSGNVLGVPVVEPDSTVRD